MTDTSKTAIRIAEWCGWRVRKQAANGPYPDLYLAYRPDGVWASTQKHPDAAQTKRFDYPDYSDLNACREFEGLLEEREYDIWQDYRDALREKLRERFEESSPHDAFWQDFCFATATAAQRCAAMEAVLDGSEGKQARMDREGVTEQDIAETMTPKPEGARDG